LVSIPRDYLFSTHTVLTHLKLGGIVRKSFEAPIGSPLSAMEVLIIGLLYFKFNPSENEYWSLYLESIPSQYTSLIFWPSEALPLLGSKRLAERVNHRLSKISGLFEHTRNTFQKFHDSTCAFQLKFLHEFSLDSFLWAYATIMSRSVFVRNAALWNTDLRLEKDIAALPPLLDFFNHSNETECSASYNLSTQCYELRTEQAWAPGDQQVFIKYGHHSNATLLLHYGFAIPNNIYDSIDLDLDLHQLIDGTVECEAKLLKLHEFGLIDPPVRPKSANRLKHTLSMDGIGWNTMVAIKTMLMDSKEETECWDALLEDSPISPNNEMKYGRYCKALYQSMLHKIEEGERIASSTIEAAEPTTSSSAPTSWSTYLHLSSIYRACCRLILNNALAHIDS